MDSRTVKLGRMDIPDFIQHEVDPIVQEWAEFARSRLSASRTWSFEELADHARVLLLAIAADIGEVQGAGT